MLILACVVQALLKDAALMESVLQSLVKPTMLSTFLSAARKLILYMSAVDRAV